jgi:hypothetical protein
LRAEPAVFRTAAGLDVDDGTKMDFVSLEFFANAIGPREQVKNVRGGFELEKPQRFIACDGPAVQNALAERGDTLVICCVNQFLHHG